MNRKYRDLTERLIANSTVDRQTGCWVWIGRRGGGRRGEYPKINIRVNGQHKTFNAHRIAYQTLKGEIPNGMTVEHECHNTICVNPDHLALLSNAENARRK